MMIVWSSKSQPLSFVSIAVIIDDILKTLNLQPEILSDLVLLRLQTADGCAFYSSCPFAINHLWGNRTICALQRNGCTPGVVKSIIK